MTSVGRANTATERDFRTRLIIGTPRRWLVRSETIVGSLHAMGKPLRLALVLFFCPSSVDCDLLGLACKISAADLGEERSRNQVRKGCGSFRAGEQRSTREFTSASRSSRAERSQARSQARRTSALGSCLGVLTSNRSPPSHGCRTRGGGSLRPTPALKRLGPAPHDATRNYGAIGVRWRRRLAVTRRCGRGPFAPPLRPPLAPPRRRRPAQAQDVRSREFPAFPP